MRKNGDKIGRERLSEQDWRGKGQGGMREAGGEEVEKARLAPRLVMGGRDTEQSKVWNGSRLVEVSELCFPVC